MSHRPRGNHGWALLGIGAGALIAGATAVIVALVVVGLLLAPLAVWLAWNVLDFAQAIGAPELGFWGIVLLTLFLVLGAAGRLVMAVIVWIADPSWLDGAATLTWPEFSVSALVALALLLLVAQIPSHSHGGGKARKAGPPRPHPREA